MALIINKQQSSSGRVPAGFGFYTGKQFYGTAPTVSGKWATYQSPLFPSVQIKAQEMFSASDAIDAGILPNTDNTASTSTWLITHIGADGETVNIKCLVPIIVGGDKPIGFTYIDLGTYTINLSVESTIALQGAALAAIINSGTYSHGFTASFSIATLTITAPKKYGIYLNTSTPYVVTLPSVPTIAGTLTQNVVPGTASQYAIWYYQISEYFRGNPTGVLWVGIIASSSSFHELLALQYASGSNLRVIGVYDNSATRGLAANIVGTCLSLQNCALLLDQNFPFEIVYSPNLQPVTDLSTMPNGQLVDYNKVTVITSQDGNAQGALLYTVSGQSIGNLGIKLGLQSGSRISASDAQPIPQFNASDGIENNIPAFSNGKFLSEISVGLQTQLAAYRYIFFRVFTGNVSGTFFTGNYCFCKQTSRYAYQNDNRVSDEITRICNTTYIPYLDSEVIFNADGTISDASIETLQDAGIDAITASMITGLGDKPLISGTPIVTIDPKQDLQNTNTLNIVVKIGENGIARNITIAQGFTN